MDPKIELGDRREQGHVGARQTTDGRVVTVTDGHWYDLLGNPDDPIRDERILVSLVPVHPSSHGVLSDGP